MKYNKTIQGFTLLEVLVALAVASIGLAGVIKVAGGNAYNAQQLQNKTLAQWVALNQITELRVTKQFPAVGQAKGDAEMAGRKWYWQQTTKVAPFSLPSIQKTLRQIEIDVYLDEDRKAGSLTTVTTFLAQP